MPQGNKEKPKRKCRNCTYDIEVGLRRCPYCGILNPTVTLKEIFTTTAVILIISAIAIYGFGLGK